MKLIYFGANPMAEPAIERWAKQHDTPVTCVHEGLTEDNIELARDYDGICTYLSNDMKDSESMYRTLHDYGIRQLSITATGIDGLNREWAEKYGFHVTNVPAYSPTSVGHFALMSILELLRGIPAVEKDTDESRAIIGRELADVTVGIIGTGRIGTVVAEGVLALGGHVIAYSFSENARLVGRVEYVGFQELLERSDVISIHVPLTPQTEHMFDAAAFASMKPNSCLVNTARGGIVDTEALVDVLKSGHVGGAALDTLEDEEQYMSCGWTTNPYYKELSEYPNVIVTPHIAYYTQRAVDEIAQTALDNARNVILNGTSNNLVM